MCEEKTKNRAYYDTLYADYPDVVTLPEFRQMLGGFVDTTARKLIRTEAVHHFYIRDTYLIPKTSVINYILSEQYTQYKKMFKAQV